MKISNLNQELHFLLKCELFVKSFGQCMPKLIEKIITYCKNKAETHRIESYKHRIGNVIIVGRIVLVAKFFSKYGGDVVIKSTSHFGEADANTQNKLSS